MHIAHNIAQSEELHDRYALAAEEAKPKEGCDENTNTFFKVYRSNHLRFAGEFQTRVTDTERYVYLVNKVQDV